MILLDPVSVGTIHRYPRYTLGVPPNAVSNCHGRPWCSGPVSSIAVFGGESVRQPQPREAKVFRDGHGNRSKDTEGSFIRLPPPFQLQNERVG